MFSRRRAIGRAAPGHALLRIDGFKIDFAPTTIDWPVLASKPSRLQGQLPIT
jgi:hypothetical protein